MRPQQALVRAPYPRALGPRRAPTRQFQALRGLARIADPRHVLRFERGAVRRCVPIRRSRLLRGRSARAATVLPQAIARAETVRGNGARLVRSAHAVLMQDAGTRTGWWRGCFSSRASVRAGSQETTASTGCSSADSGLIRAHCSVAWNLVAPAA